MLLAASATYYWDMRNVFTSTFSFSYSTQLSVTFLSVWLYDRNQIIESSKTGRVSLTQIILKDNLLCKFFQS